MNDMPKLECPFVRDVETHLATPQIAEGMEWVFSDPLTMAIEKLDGTNVSIYMDQGSLVGVRNRTNVIQHDTLANNRFIQGVRSSHEKGRLPMRSGQHFGELMGPKIQSNFLKLDSPEWFPFEYLRVVATYKSFHKYPKTFENISAWFKNDLFSLVYARIHKGDKVFPEGIVFTHPDGRMAKLRRDMFDWFEGARHKEGA